MVGIWSKIKDYEVYYRGDLKIIEVDTKKANYQGISWSQCSEFQKRKYENYLVLSNNTREQIKIIYR